MRQASVNFITLILKIGELKHRETKTRSLMVFRFLKINLGVNGTFRSSLASLAQVKHPPCTVLPMPDPHNCFHNRGVLGRVLGGISGGIAHGS